jgi:carbon monoxide dehydrogenase subunit G
MAIKIEEKFQVPASIDVVWRFMMDPEQVVTCIPGATLDGVVDDRTFLGSVKVKVGAVSAKYKGQVQFTEIDEAGRSILLAAEGRETGGGMAKGTLSSRLRSLEDGGTEIETDASIDLTGRIMQVGRGMIEGVSKQLFQQFVSSTKTRLEVSAAGGDVAALPAQTELRILPLLLRTLREAIARFFRRLFGRSRAT